MTSRPSFWRSGASVKRTWRYNIKSVVTHLCQCEPSGHLAEMKRRLLAFAYGMIGHRDANEAYAKDAVIQPLTRADCAQAGQTWNDNANVCGTTSQESETAPRSEAAGAFAQPLTRRECDLAGMRWNDSANVCAEKTGGSTSRTESTEANPVSPTVLINIDKTRQRMTVFLDGAKRYDWPVSTGQRGYSTPSGSFTASSMNEIWYSKQWDNAPMPHAVFFTKEGHAIHGTNEVKRLGRPASHGCVRLSPDNAATLYALVKENGLENTQVVLTGVTPGGEGKVASRPARKTRDVMRSRPRYRTELYFEHQTRGGLFGRRWR